MARLSTAAFVALLVVLAGCGAFSAAPESATERSTATVDGVDTLPPVAVEVSVTAVVDGDTIRIAYDNGTTDTVRLVGVDTPEVHVGNDPAEFEGVPATEAGRSCLRTAGTNASNHVKERLLGRDVGLAFDPKTERRGFYDRLLAYVVVDDRFYNYRLVATGHARVYDSDFSRADQFYRAETTAREQRRGLWRCTDPAEATGTLVADGGTVTASDSGLVVASIEADAAGNDNENLNGEFVVFENRGEEPLELDGWTVSDEADHSYTFENLTLDPGARVTLYTGSGTDTQTERYWGRTGAVWNNGGDTVVVRDATGSLVLERAY